MAGHPRPTVRRRKLGSEFKRLREAAGVKMDDAAERIGGDKSKISRQENGRQGMNKLEAEALLDLYGVEDERLRTALITMAREGRRKGWWAQYSDILQARLEEQISIESDAAKILAFQSLLIPGLFQTAEYATEVIRSFDKGMSSEKELDSLISVRMTRQEIFQRVNAPHHVCILDEAVLRREIGGPGVMAAQLDKLIEVSNPPKLTIQVIPFGQGWHPGLSGPYTIYSYPDPMELDVVKIGYLDGSLFLEEDAAVERFRLAFDELRASAQPVRQSLELIRTVARGYRQRT
ncbi:helix-turn-helix domain-containing protein [Streptomyces sp. NPDC007088]|uniref:helix-turn-helix domain-containing protein n=1 Tax=Streptomyces sp. NPDC007088 TaxID=3364773 RepID=UPI00368E1EA2